jgi:HTH-type transcriptional regulator / antitoxin HipB
MMPTAKSVGMLVRKVRKSIGVTQRDLALTSGTGLRFISDLENGKATCQLEKVLTVLNTLGIKVEFTTPALLKPGMN